MKRHLLILILGIFVGSAAIGSLGGTIIISPVLEPLQSDCNFKCERVPEPHEVLKHLGGRPSTDALPQRSLNVLNWNIYKGRKEAFPQVFRALARNADLVMISEATDARPVKPAIEELPGFSWWMSINFFMKDDVATGLLNGSYARSTWQSFAQTLDREPFVKSPKTLLMNRYAVRSAMGVMGEILVINIHGINWAGDDAFGRHIALAEPAIRVHRGPILFAGDYNTKNPSRQRILEAFGARHGMKRVNWENPPAPGKKQLDDAMVRGFRVDSARFVYEVINAQGSDHPAMQLQLTPFWGR